MNLKWLDFFFLLQVFPQRNVALQALGLHGCWLQPPVLGDPKPLLQLSDERENATKAAQGLWLWFTVSSSLHEGFPFLTYDLITHLMLYSFHSIQHLQMLKDRRIFSSYFYLIILPKLKFRLKISFISFYEDATFSWQEYIFLLLVHQ